MKKGFTLIELLVVIAIIGILSSVVLASLNSARNKGANAAIKSGLANTRAQAELYYDGQTPQSYAGVCEDAVSGIEAMVAQASSTAADTNAKCKDDPAGWSASVKLKVTESGMDYWCVGSSGASKLFATEISAYGDCK